MNPGREPRPVGQFLQHVLLAGPALGLLACLHTYGLSRDSPTTIDTATHHVIRQTKSWHGKTLGFYYITPRQQWIQECLAFPVGCWMISVVAGLVFTGFRFDAPRRHANRNRHPSPRRPDSGRHLS